MLGLGRYTRGDRIYVLLLPPDVTLQRPLRYNTRMSKEKKQYVCTACGSVQLKWSGKCPECGEWNTLEEEIVRVAEKGRPSAAAILNPGQPVPLSAVARDDLPRLPLSIGELNRVLGGGIVPGSCVLVGGEPGVGKSTLLLAMAADVANSAGTVLYVSAEESAHQIGRRAARLGIRNDNLFILSEIMVEAIVEQIEALKPTLVIVDSVQAIYSGAGGSAAGTVSQVRDCAAALLRVAKAQNVPVFLVGHVTKEGSIAGPKVLEHMVDAVLQLEGERFHAFRLLRSVKNRFGSTNEVGVFEMVERGMEEVRNPSELFLAERLPNATGSAIAVSMEGTRPLLVEVQALSSTTAFSMPRRTGNGVDQNRLLLLTAVLSKRVGLDLSDQDVFVNIVGGMRVDEPAADLAIACAVASSYRNRPVWADLAIMGEVGLSGELRSVGQVARRLHEAAKLGFARALTPRSMLQRKGGEALPTGIEVIGVRTLYEALDVALVK
jgi:DNA repair protein RadA/Sms